MTSNREYVIPESLPILTLKKDVLLPGASLVLHVEDEKGCVTIIEYFMIICLCLHSFRLVANCLWEDKNWSSRFIGVVPYLPGTNEVHI